MCGIVAMVQLDGTPVDLPLLAHMAAALDHRGPDDEGHVVDDTVGLYHKRLSIIDLKTGQQPMTRRRTTVTFNGEIYNYVELRDDLKRRGRPFQTTSDTEVILAMYEEYGTDFIPALNGMFAFVLYDRNRRRLIAARDHFGIKPLYYHVDDRRVVFASEIKALLRHPDIASVPDREAMRDYLTFQFVLGDATLFSPVQEVITRTLNAHHLHRSVATRLSRRHHGYGCSRDLRLSRGTIRHANRLGVEQSHRAQCPRRRPDSRRHA